MTKKSVARRAKDAKANEAPITPVLDLVNGIKARVEEICTLMSLAKTMHGVEITYSVGPRDGDPNTIELKGFRAVRSVL